MSQRITITLPMEVYQKVKEQAERDFRTIGAEIAYLLHVHVPAYKNIALDSSQITPRSTPTPENPTGQSHTPTANTSINTNPYYDSQGRRTVIS